jgi:hypothetical protein
MGTHSYMVTTGRVGPVIFYKRGNTYCSRSMPGKVKQTEATKRRSMEFGKASKIGKSMREMLKPVIPVPLNHSAQLRLVKVLFEFLRTGFSIINEFSFSAGRTLEERWRTALTITLPTTGTVQVEIPSFVPVVSIPEAPKSTVSVTCLFAVASMTDDGVAIGSWASSLEIKYDSIEVEAQTISFPLPTPADSIVITGMYLQFNVVKNNLVEKTTDTAFMPAGMVSIIRVKGD